MTDLADDPGRVHWTFDIVVSLLFLYGLSHFLWPNLWIRWMNSFAGSFWQRLVTRFFGAVLLLVALGLLAMTILGAFSQFTLVLCAILGLFAIALLRRPENFSSTTDGEDYYFGTWYWPLSMRAGGLFFMAVSGRVLYLSLKFHVDPLIERARQLIGL